MLDASLNHPELVALFLHLFLSLDASISLFPVSGETLGELLRFCLSYLCRLPKL